MLTRERIVTGAKLLAQRIRKLLGVHEREMIAIGVGETLLNRSRAHERQRGALKLFPSSAHHYLGVRRLFRIGFIRTEPARGRRRLVLVVAGGVGIQARSSGCTRNIAQTLEKK